MWRVANGCRTHQLTDILFFRNWSVALNFKFRSNRSRRKWADISAAFPDNLCPIGTLNFLRLCRHIREREGEGKVEGERDRGTEGQRNIKRQSQREKERKTERKKERKKKRKKERNKERKKERKRNVRENFFLFCFQSWLCSHEGRLGIQRGRNRKEQTHPWRINCSTQSGKYNHSFSNM